MWQHIHAYDARRQAGKPAPKTPQPERVRHRDWTATYEEDPDAFDDLALPDRERVMPVGETERRQVKAPPSPLHDGMGSSPLAPRRNGGTDAPADGQISAAPQTASEGMVIEVSSGLCRVRMGEDTLLCSLRNSLRQAAAGFSNIVAAGDAVLVAHNGQPHGQGVIEAVLPRRSALARPDPFYGHLQQVIVANVDQLLIVAAWRDPGFWPELADRYLIAAARHGLAPILCINKIDLADDAAELAAVQRAYEAAVCRVIMTSAETGIGLDALRGVLRGKTTALAGLSGVGKSSLLSAVEPGLNLRIGEVSTRRHEGRHTTTQVSLHALADGGFVVDTPGIREFGLSGLGQANLANFYPEIAALAPACEFANCTHTREPGCAVKAAGRAGRLSPMRYDSYRKIYRSLPAN